MSGPIKAQCLADMLHRVAFLVIPSRIESIPLILSDALQADTPVVASPVGDLPRVLESTECGVLSGAVSPDSLAVALQEALRSEPESFAGGVEEAKKLFDLSTAVDEWLDRAENARP